MPIPTPAVSPAPGAFSPSSSASPIIGPFGNPFTGGSGDACSNGQPPDVAADVFAAQILSVISSKLPEWKRFPTGGHVAYRMMEVLWAGAGNASRLRALVKNGQYHGARIVDIEPSEYFGADPVSVLWTHGPKAERLMDLGHLDASRALDGIGGQKD